jgi:hypothetical protein
LRATTSSGYFAVPSGQLWPAVDHATDGAVTETSPELGTNELLLATLVGIVKPEYVGNRWSPLEDGETWEEFHGVGSQPGEFMPVEVLLHSLAGRLRYLGATSRRAAALLERLGVPSDDAVAVTDGTLLSRACTPPREPGPDSFPPELLVLDKTDAPRLSDLVHAAARTYRDADEQFVVDLAVFMGAGTPDEGLDRLILGDLAMLISIYDTLVDTDDEVLFATIL